MLHASCIFFIAHNVLENVWSNLQSDSLIRVYTCGHYNGSESRLQQVVMRVLLPNIHHVFLSVCLFVCHR